MRILSRLKDNKWLILIIFLTIIIRFLFLDRIPPSISGDELQYVLNTKAFMLTGYDLSGKISAISPLFFTYPVGILPQAELPYYLLLPFVSLPFSLFTSRLPFAILGISFVPVMYFLGKELGGKRVGILSAFFTACNPWLFLIAHTAYESTVAMFFYMTSLLILLKFEGKKRLLALPLFLLAFYSYIGTKVILIPFIIVAVAYVFLTEKKNKRDYSIPAIVIIFSILITIIYLLLQSSSGRIGEIQTPFSPQITEQVNYIRQVSIASPLLSLVENRLTIYILTLAKKTLDIFSADYLFISGDNFFGIWRHGLFYILDAVLIVLGSYNLLKKKRILFWFLAALAIVGILPQLLHQQQGNFTPHITMLIPILIVVCAFGGSYFWEITQKIPYRNLVRAFGVGAYVLSIVYFIHLFIFQYPIQGTYDISSRVLSKYLSLATQQGENVYIFSHRPSDLYKKYLFYSNSLDQTQVKKVQTAISTNTYRINNLFFEDCGDKQKANLKGTVLTDKLCENMLQGKPTTSLVNIKDDSDIYLISGDSVCEGRTAWMTTPVNLTDFKIENINLQRFCSVYLRQAR